MDGKTFLYALVFGFLAMVFLGTYCGMPEMGPIVAIAVAGGRIAWLLQRGGRRRITSCSAYSPLVSPFNPKGGPP